MAVLTYQRGTRREYSVAILKLDDDRVIMTALTAPNWSTLPSLVVHRSEMENTIEAMDAFRLQCGRVAERSNAVDIVRVICELLNCPVPTVYSS